MSFLINPFRFTSITPGCSGDLISISNLQAYYNFNGSVIDYSGNDNQVFGSSLTYTSSGKFSSGGTFNGTSDYVRMPLKDYSLSTGYTVMAWIKRTSSGAPGGAGYQIFTSDQVNATPNIRLWQFGINPSGYLGFVRFDTNTTVCSNFTASAATINDTDWHHVAATFDNTIGSRIYQDGVEIARDSVTTNNYNPSNKPSIGAMFGQTGGGADGKWYAGFYGTIDEATLFSRGLSASEIATVYAGTCPLRATIMTANTVGYYAMEANSNDSSPSVRDLTNTNVTWAPGKGGVYSAAFITGSTNPASATKKLTTATQIVDTASSNTSGYSISCWINYANLPISAARIWWMSPASKRNVELFYDGTNYTFLVFDGGSAYTYSVPKTPSTGVWYHLCFVMQPTTGAFQLFLDGVSVLTGTNTNNGNAGSSIGLSIGCHGGAAASFTGYIDEFAIWARPLAYNEVQNLYNSGAGDFYPFSS